MRLLIQLLIPALIVVAIAVMIWRRRSTQPAGPEQPMSTAAFIAVITIGAALAAALVLATQG
jgi:hypothetical protein